MSCKKEGCCSNRPVAEMVALPDWIVAELMIAAGTGLARVVPWPSETLRKLAEKVASLAAENIRLRALVKPDQPQIVNGVTATVTFGPQSQYSLHIPVHDSQTRKQLAQSFLLAAAELQKSAQAFQAPPEQLDLPFTE